ncbi:tetratricopeptide repeat protein [Fulvivirga sp. 29W222]|uniref:Tetratricopeptide repeat protein n=1 Tax=Fulvivirga marina TaxID=2494733 RepID=A0A937KBJ0_9BACT|nr:tetratricopeptide repeat protein [Fulvivirga marina]MBL6446237.1 tetratricopeptide repeat protein [Fulvivirga marina]
MRYIPLTVVLVLGCLVCKVFAQTRVIDSLKNVVAQAGTDSVKIESLRQLGVLMSDHDVAMAIDYVNKAIELSDAKGYELQKTDAINSLGIIYYGIGDYEQTLDCFLKVQAFQESRNDLKGMSRVYNNLGLLFKELGRYEKSIDYLEKSVELKLQTSDTLTLSSSYNNLGLVYQEGLNDYKRAAECHNKALVIDRRNKDDYGIFVSLANIGLNHFKLGNLDSAQYFYNNAVMLFGETDDKYVKAEFLYEFALLNAALGQFDRAIEKHNLSIEMAEKADIKLLLKKNYEGLSDIYTQLGDFKKALNFHKMYSDVNRELFNVDQTTKIADIETNYHIQTKQNEIELLRKEAEIKDLKIYNDQMAFYWLVGMLVLVVFIVVLQYRKDVYRTRTNKILKQKNQEIIAKNQNIMDSILYAKNIQEAILAENDRLKAVFEDAFVLTKPRDIVNGDFYWFAEDGNHVVIAAVDCTGHGIPAAFLNVMGNSLLNQIVNEEKIIEPAEILRELNIRVFKNLKYDNAQSKSNDGMDIGICLFNRDNRRLAFAGAKRPLYYFHNHELNVLKGDHYPVGGILYDEHRIYHQHELVLEVSDSIYLFTDGIVDQFGGKENKKFMYPRFRELLRKVADYPMTEQVEAIEEEISRWQGNNEQTDDILMIGVRF